MLVHKLLLGILLTPCGLLHAEEIPLDQVWAYNMPGTKDVCDLGQEYLKLSKEILSHLSRGTKSSELAGPAFIVQGSKLSALRNSHQVLVNRIKPENSFTTEAELSAFFFSRESSRYVHLRKIVIESKSIRIFYELVPHKSKELSSNFAVFDLGKLEAGKYQLEIVHQPNQQNPALNNYPPVPEDYIQRVVCHSSEFVVKE
jgi:hypothetical protein